MRKFYFLFAIFFFSVFNGQQVSSVLERNTIELGEPTTITINVKNLNGKKVITKPENELLPFHFEEIKDSISVSEEEYNRVIEFAIYEEGTFNLPELEFKIGDYVYHTVPYIVTVVNPVQESDEMYDIMNNKELDLSWGDYWELYKFYLLVALLIIAIIILLIGFIKYFRRDKDTPEEKTHQALKKIKQLEKKKYIEQLNYRAFYVELIDITREFITKQYNIPADVLLTDDLIHLMKETDTISHENEKLLDEVLMRGDQVKFAKMITDKETMLSDINNIKNFVKQSVKDIEFENLRTGV